MKTATKLVAALGVSGVLAATAVFAGSLTEQDGAFEAAIMKPGKGVSLDIGSKHAVGYFQQTGEACELTIVMADVTGGEIGKDSPGTRIVVPVMPGRGLKIDASADKTAEFFCGPGASQMSARVIDRAPYKS